MTAATSLREGELVLGEATLRRGETRYGLAVGLMIAVGLGVAGTAAALALDEQEEPPRDVQHGEFTLKIPPDWSPAEGGPLPPAIGSASADFGGVGYLGPSGELTLMWRRVPVSDADDPRDDLFDSLRPPGIEHRLWKESSRGSARVADMAYPSPRGTVRARVVAVVEHDEDGPASMVYAIASCSYEGRDGDCEAIASSLTRRER